MQTLALDSSPATAAAYRCRLCGSAALADIGVVAGHDFLECGHCGFVFTPSLRPAAAEARYRADEVGSPQGGWADEAFLQPALERLHAAPLDILDFGCGESRLPAQLRARGHRVIGVDLAPPDQPHPDRYTGDIRTLALPPTPFDLVCAYQVFEHLPQPALVLEALLAHTRRGGLLLIHTDMETAERARGFADWWYVLPPHHCSFYRHRSFDVFCGNTPHRVVWRDPKSVIIRKS